MNEMIRKFIKSFLTIFVKLISKNKAGRYFITSFINESMKLTSQVYHNDYNLTFCTPNGISYWRAQTFSEKEPETLAWIDSFTQGSCFWDIGANVGLYTCYAAKSKNCNVIAFEPSVFNLEILSRNISINKLADKTVIFPIPLTEKNKTSEFNFNATEWGEALSTFGEDYSHDGKELDKIFAYTTNWH